VSGARETTAEQQLGWACAMIALGGALLGLQFDGQRSLVGTGYTALGIGAVIALVVVLLESLRSQAVPREPLTFLSALSGFAGMSFVIGGVLAPGGTWMFLEVLVLLWLLARGPERAQRAGPDLGAGAIFALALMLVFRLWITYQGSEHRWQLMSVSVPIVSSIPLSFLDPIKTVSLGSFDPEDIGYPLTGLDFPRTIALWSAGFALAVLGLVWRARAAFEHENDRIHATIHALPPPIAVVIEKLLPEEDWRTLGLHGLSERMRRKKIESLVEQAIRERREIDVALRRVPLLEQTNAGGFAGDIQNLLMQNSPSEGSF
jgi:hypothetical protein